MTRSWDLTHNPFDRPLGCNGRYGPSGYNKHRFHGEEACDRCKASNAHYKREYRRKGVKPRQLKPCGTPAAAVRHRQRGEPVCFACRVAESRQQAEIRTRSRSKLVTLPSKGPYSPFAVGKRTLVARTCLDCGELADGDSFPLLNKGKGNQARRRVCHKCHNLRKKRDREERGIGLPTPRPPEELQTSKYELWTNKDLDYLKDAFKNGYSYEDIAIALGRSASAVFQQRVRMGLPRQRKQHRVEKPWKIAQ